MQEVGKYGGFHRRHGNRESSGRVGFNKYFITGDPSPRPTVPEVFRGEPTNRGG